MIIGTKQDHRILKYIKKITDFTKNNLYILL